MQKAVVSELIERYSKRTEEDCAFEAGKSILAGDCSRRNLKAIMMWKSPRTAGVRLETDEQKICEALRAAIACKNDPLKAIEALWNLKGVGVPVASAIMTAIDPENYTVIDYRARKSLEAFFSSSKFSSKHGKGTPGEYVDYLRFCKCVSSENGVSLRTLDYALWQYSYESGIDWIA